MVTRSACMKGDVAWPLSNGLMYRLKLQTTKPTHWKPVYDTQQCGFVILCEIHKPGNTGDWVTFWWRLWHTDMLLFIPLYKCNACVRAVDMVCVIILYDRFESIHTCFQLRLPKTYGNIRFEWVSEDKKIEDSNPFQCLTVIGTDRFISWVDETAQWLKAFHLLF